MMPTTQTDRAELIAQWLPQICEALLRADPDILAVVQFGSSVYAPELALDLDLLVITKRKKAMAFIGTPFGVPGNLSGWMSSSWNGASGWVF
jgi:hypothetical protein